MQPNDRIHTLRRTARARGLYEAAQTLQAAGGADGSARARRLYARALRTLEPRAPRDPDAPRQALRDAVWERLWQRSLWARLLEHRRAIATTFAAIVFAAAACITLVPSLRERAFPTNLAEGKAWVASSSLPGFAAIGVMPSEPPPDFLFHTLQEPTPAVMLDLGSIVRVRAVEIVNRASCCRERAVPLSIALSTDGSHFTRVAQRRDIFDTWTAHFAPRPARFVRARVERPSFLHLRQIAVY